MNTGEKIKQHRLLKKVSPKDLADALGMDVSNYYRIERNEVKPDIENLVKIAEHLDVEPSELLSEDKVVFNITSTDSQCGILYNPTMTSNDKLTQLFEDKINLLLEKNTMLIEKMAEKDNLLKKLTEEIEMLKSKIK